LGIDYYVGRFEVGRVKGTLINTGTVVVGSTLGLMVGQLLPANAQDIALSGIGLVNLALGVKMFLPSKNLILVAACIALGGILGLLLGVQSGLEALSVWAKEVVGGRGKFSEGLLTASILCCVGPMTILGCIQDGLECRSELLGLKSTLDGVAGFFLAASLGVGVLFSAVVILVFQGMITLLASRLKWLREDEELLNEFTAVGGLMILSIGISLLGLKQMPTANYLPGLLMVPVLHRSYLAFKRYKTSSLG
jgi:uncharacterized membrane protein YqgA involved in biofilm formation